YPLYTTSQTFYHNEINNYEGTLNTSRVWNMRMYDNGTVVLRVVRIKRIPDKPPNIGLCMFEEFSLRIIYPNGTVVENDILLDIPEFNYCSRADRTDPLKPRNLELIEYYLIGKKYILVTYFNATNSSDYDTYEDWGVIIDYNGNVLDRIRFGVSFTVNHKLVINTHIVLNVNREKGFIRLNFIKGSLNAEWRQFYVNSDGKLTDLTNGTLNFIDYTTLTVNVISTVDEGYAIVYANMTGKFQTIDTNDTIENSTEEMLSPKIQLFATLIRHNGTLIEPFILYQSSLPNLIIESLHCSIAYVDVGQICVLTLKNQGNKRFVVKNAFVSCGTVFSSSTFHYLLPDIDFNEYWDLVSLPFDGYLITNKIAVKGSKGILMHGFLLNQDKKSIEPWGLEEPRLCNVNGDFLVLPNNTMIIANLEDDNGNSWSFTIHELPKMLDRKNDYLNANIESSSPPINGIVIPGQNIEINFYVRVELSDGQIEIHQIESGQTSLRQIIHSSSEDILLKNEGKTLVIKVYDSTFSVSYKNYFIKMDNNFVKSYVYRESLMGIKENIWTVISSERTVNDERFYPTTTCQLRLTDEGTKAYEEYLSAGNRTIFFDSLLKELVDAVPINIRLLDSNKYAERDFDVENHSFLYLISVVIKQVDSEQDVGTVIKYLRTLIRNKKYTPIGSGKFTKYLDDTFGIEVTTNLWKKYKYGLFSVILIGLVIGPSFFFFSKKKGADPEKNKKVYSKDDKDFNKWLKNNIALASILATLSCADIEVFSVLTLEGLPEKYKAPFSPDAETRMVFVAFLNIFAEDIPQFIIQILYMLRTVNYGVIPLLTLFTSALSLTRNI
ncbi:182_t:CDS:2, partial [Funneliformis caledonium]